ncbi:hypothetical protein [Haloarchaeobius sp. DYHT-AS-18]|uniref:hypothetical protein n=1 Tax=Haloarchaeobius sp. DYHT-AS-18 TaxID=3446117 RepID=UPI003EBC0AEF
MKKIDDRILEHLNETSWATPHSMSYEPEFRYASERRIAERCWMLAHADMIAPMAERTYEITTWGQLYLDGEIDAAHQPYPTPKRMLRG